MIKQHLYRFQKTWLTKCTLALCLFLGFAREFSFACILIGLLLITRFLWDILAVEYDFDEEEAQ